MTPGGLAGFAVIAFALWIVGIIWFGTARAAHRKKWGPLTPDMKASKSMGCGGILFLLGMSGTVVLGTLALAFWLFSL